VRGQIALPGYPFGVAAVTAGPNADRKVYVSSEQDGTISVVDPTAQRVSRKIATGASPTCLLLDRSAARLFVANSGSDTVSIVSTDRDSVQKTVLLRPATARDLPAATPLGLALSPDEKTLYVALGDMNAVAVVDVEKATVSGYIPVGWYPTAVVASADGRRLFVANAKGVAERNPNGKPVERLKGRPQYIQSIIEGTVSTVDLAAATADLPSLTDQVVANNRIVRDPVAAARSALKNPGIDHVVYVIKENRTYDQVLGDLPQGNGDPELTLFGREVTPNLHALAERFVLLDNFYCAAEVSGDGWNWSTQGMANEYDARNVVYGYTGKNRPYDYEGSNRGVPVDLFGIRDVARAPGGYIWDNCARHKVSFRNYGFFTDDFDLPRESPEFGTRGLKNAPSKKALTDRTCLDFRQFDMNFADSEAWVKHGLAPAPKQMAKYGSHDDPSRITTWRREFDAYVKDRNLPRFLMVRLPRDHTAGTTAGIHSPRAMAADNDYAVGQLVEAISRSPYWKSTAIFIVEDDAQNGHDHVDAHRSIAFVISPFVRRATKDSRFYNTASVLHTMENLLGLPPMNLYDATAPVLAVFADRPENEAPFEAILPDKAIIGEVNGATAYRSRDSARLLNRFKEESAPDEELNDILWHSIKGRDVPAPARRYGPRFAGGEAAD
jgi:YVTN family beta-propeller protein